MEGNRFKFGFTDEEPASVSLPSVWRKSQQSARDSKACQTGRVHRADVHTQAVVTSSSCSQTEAPGPEQLPGPAAIGPSPADVKEFLQKVEDMMVRELERNVQSHAFDGFRVDREDPGQQVCLLHRLQLPGDTHTNLHVSCVSWSCTGSRIICAYGRTDDGDWSTENSLVCGWNLDGGGVCRKADLLQDVDTAVTALSCHPLQPALMAGGLFTGEVLVWDSSRTLDPVLARTGMLAESHREPVYHVSWVSPPQQQQGEEFHVLSCCSGGKVLVWTLGGDPPRLVLSHAFALVGSQIPPSSSNFKVCSGSVGVTALSVSPWDSDTFLVGCEGGLLLRCSFSSQTSVDSSSSPSSPSPSSSEQPRVTLRAPAVFAFTQKNGPVHSIHFSPFHRNLFLCCGTDGSVHLHSLLQAAPLLSVRVSDSYLFQVQWSPTRPLVFAVATGQGQVHLFDLGRGSLKPALVLQREASGHAATCLSFNSHNPRLLAVGSSDGSVVVWQLSAELSEQDAKEGGRLDSIANQVSE